MISIVVPYWNSGEWLGRCVESMHRQDGDMEFLLVDDQSTDNGADIARKFADIDDRFILLDNERHKGVSGARNTGIDHSSGEWITFLDADDELTDNAYKAYRGAIKRQDADVHQLNHMRADRKTGALQRAQIGLSEWYKGDNLPDYWFGVWNKLFRAELIKDIRFDESLQYGEDGMFVMECLAKGRRIHFAGQDLVSVVHHFDNRQSLSHVKTAEDIIRQIDTYEEFMKQQTDSGFRRMLCAELSKLWDTMSYIS